MFSNHKHDMLLPPLPEGLVCEPEFFLILNAKEAIEKSVLVLQ